MVGYVMYGTNDLAKSSVFYDQIFELLGARRIHEDSKSIAWAKEGESVIFVLTLPVNKLSATSGNGTMIALCAESKAKVDELYGKAIELGASDEGAPGMRSGGFYCAYVRDLDSNKLNFHFNPKSENPTLG